MVDLTELYESLHPNFAFDESAPEWISLNETIVAAIGDADMYYEGDEGLTIFTTALADDNLFLVKALIDAGIDLDRAGEREHAIFYAAVNGGINSFKYMVNLGMPLDKTDYYGYTLMERMITHCCHCEFEERFTILLDAGMLIPKGALVFATKNSHNMAIKLLIAKGVDPLEPDEDGDTCIMGAYRLNLKIEGMWYFDWLVKQGAVDNELDRSCVYSRLGQQTTVEMLEDYLKAGGTWAGDERVITIAVYADVPNCIFDFLIKFGAVPVINVAFVRYNEKKHKGLKIINNPEIRYF